MSTELTPAAAALPSAASIAKLLASPKTSARNRGVRLLSSYLPSLSPLPTSSTTLLKIWKGLFFCFWHADKTLYQSSLATSIASLISSNSNSPDLACLFLDASLLTLRREWANIDYRRMDKFYLLVRRIFNHTFMFLKGNSWDSQLVGRVMGIVEERALGAEGTKGFSYHVVEIFLEEIGRFLPVTKGTVEVVVAPFLRILESSVDPTLVHKVKVDVFMKLVMFGGRYLEVKKGAGEIEKGSDVEKFGSIGLSMGFSIKLLDLAKQEETVQANKTVLHELRDGFFKLEKDLEKSGIEISLPETETEIPNEVMQIENGDDAGDQLPKKRKKEKELVETKGKKKKEKKNKKKKMKTKDNTEEPLVSGNNIVSEKNTDSGTKEDKESEKGNENMINFDENVISNLQKQFEKAAAEAGMSAESKYEIDNSLKVTPVNPPKITKKRKQAKSANKMEISSELELSAEDGNAGTNGENISSSVKKVRFSMKNNLVWKPSTPMPPQSLRLPPSATPRGSALKQGVPAGPVRDMSSPVAKKRRKPKAKSAKKVLHKGSKSPSLAVKRLRKLQSLSA